MHWCKSFAAVYLTCAATTLPVVMLRYEIQLAVFCNQFPVELMRLECYYSSCYWRKGAAGSQHQHPLKGNLFPYIYGLRKKGRNIWAVSSTSSSSWWVGCITHYTWTRIYYFIISSIGSLYKDPLLHLPLTIHATCTCSRYCRLQLLQCARPSAHSWLDGVPYTTLKGRNKKLGGTEGE